MLKITLPSPLSRPLLAALLLAALGLCGAAHAQVSLTSQVTFNLGVYTYTYSVANTGSFDLALVNVPANRQSGLLNLTAPTGFTINFDPGPGIVSFLEDNNPATTPTFAPGSTISGFSFTSAFGPGAVTFDSLDAAGNPFTGPTQSAVVPEPTPTVALLAGVALAAGFALRRRVASHQVSVQ